MPVVTFPPVWETGASAADPAISASFGSYTGPGYAGTGYVAIGQGTINVGNPVTVPPAGFPAQVRFYIGADGMLHALSNQVGTDYVATTIAGAPQQPPYYSPTK